MKFQPIPGAYAAIDPFKPSIAFSVKKLLGPQKAPQDDMDLNSPPPRVAISTGRHGASAIRPPTNTAVGARYEASPEAWIPTTSPRIRLPSPHELRADNSIPQASDSSIRPPPPQDFQHVQGDLQSDWNNRPPAVRMDATSTNSRQRNTSPYQNSEFRSQHRSRSLSPSDRNRGRGRLRSPLTLRDSSQVGSSRADEQPCRTSFRSRHHSRSPSPSAEKNRERSSSQRRRRFRNRSKSPVQSRRSGRTTSRSHSPGVISIEPPQSPPLPSFSRESSDAKFRLLSSPTRNSTLGSPLPEPDFPTPYRSASAIPSQIAERTQDGRGSVIILPPRHSEYPPSLVHEKTDAPASVVSHRGAVSEPFDEVELWDHSESVHRMTYIAAFLLDTLPRQLYLYFLLRIPYMYFSRVTRIFEEAEMSMPQIKQGILEAAIQLKEPVKDVADAWKLEPVESVQYSKLQNTWKSFIDSLMREWKTLNIISVLLLS